LFVGEFKRVELEKFFTVKNNAEAFAISEGKNVPLIRDFDRLFLL
jgi:hypothetical protein